MNNLAVLHAYLTPIWSFWVIETIAATILGLFYLLRREKLSRREMVAMGAQLLVFAAIACALAPSWHLAFGLGAWEGHPVSIVAFGFFEKIGLTLYLGLAAYLPVYLMRRDRRLIRARNALLVLVVAFTVTQAHAYYFDSHVVPRYCKDLGAEIRCTMSPKP